MKKALFLVALLCCAGGAWAQNAPSRDEMLRELQPIPPDEYYKKAVEINKLRQTRQVSPGELLPMLEDKNTVILDVRGDDAYKQMHVKGVVHLSLSDMTPATLAKAIPSKTTRVVLYCDSALLTYPTRKIALSTQAYAHVYQHGYENLYEVGQLWKSEWFSMPNKDEANMRRQYTDFLKVPLEGDQKFIDDNRENAEKALKNDAAK